MRKFLQFARRFQRKDTTIPPVVQGERLSNHLRELFALLHINCVVDIGANQGQYGRFLRELGFTGAIFSFEPAPADFLVLQQSAAHDPLWHTYPYALGQTESTQTFNITSDSLFNSFLQPNEFILGQGLKINQTIQVPLKRLDAIWEELLASIAQPHVYLKIDTQGYDAEVLAGAAGVLGQIVALQSEVAVLSLYQNGPTYLDSMHSLNTLGYEVTGLFPIARDNMLRVVEFDCVMVKSSLVGEPTALYPA